ncbi:MAG: F0F1 ATP synthase subunit gamma [Sulfitobacter sp.]|nr:F0F1 ATP synthase subunit gamma [Sulfitobacter sp.]
MTERLADIRARIEGIQQLGAVVNAMKGVAAAHAHLAQTQIDAVDGYAATISAAMSSVLRPLSTDAARKAETADSTPGLLVFCAELGFAGAFSERLLDSLGSEAETAELFLIGTRGLSIATARGIKPHWTAPLPSHTAALPKLANQITTAIYQAVAYGRIDSLDVVFNRLHTGRPQRIRQRLFPIDLARLSPNTTATRPLTQLPQDTLIYALGQEYFYAQVCKAALHAFAAENEARMEAMSAAGNQIARELDTFQAMLRRVRQEAITAEIIELGTGAASTQTRR